MIRISQVVGNERRVKETTQTELDTVRRDAGRTQSNGPLHGLSAIYQPFTEDGEQLPAESTRVQVTVEGLLARTQLTFTQLFDLIATKDWANQHAAADVMVDGKSLLTGVPVTYLLFLEKQLTALSKLYTELPTLDPAETWTYRSDVGCWASEPVQTRRTRKIPRNHVLVEATAHHPAQVQVYQEDQPMGTWTRVKYCGAMPEDRKRTLLRRVEELLAAVVSAREEANTTKVEERKVAKVIFDHLFAE